MMADNEDKWLWYGSQQNVQLCASGEDKATV